MAQQDMGPAPDAPVLVGVDDAHDQQAVLLYAGGEAVRRGRPLHILHAVEWPLPARTSEIYPEVTTPQAQAAAVLAPFMSLAHAEFPGLRVVTEPFSGSPSAALVDRSSRAALLVVGHRGTGGFPRLPLGSVSWQVATHAACPVVVIRPGRTGARPENRVVAGVDTAGDRRTALGFAVAEAELRGAGLVLLHAVPPHPQLLSTGPAASVAGDPEAGLPVAREILEEMAEACRSRFPNVPVTTRVAPGRPASVLAEASENAALVVVGSHGRTGLRRILLGSVSAEVLHTASAPVAVVPVTPPG